MAYLTQSFNVRWRFLRYRDGVGMCLATMLVDEFILVVVHWSEFVVQIMVLHWCYIVLVQYITKLLGILLQDYFTLEPLGRRELLNQGRRKRESFALLERKHEVEMGGEMNSNTL